MWIADTELEGTLGMDFVQIVEAHQRPGPPHPLHFWGVLEREIGTIRCLLNTMLVKLGGPQVTHKLLLTLMA